MQAADDERDVEGIGYFPGWISQVQQLARRADASLVIRACRSRNIQARERDAGKPLFEIDRVVARPAAKLDHSGAVEIHSTEHRLVNEAAAILHDCGVILMALVKAVKGFEMRLLTHSQAGCARVGHQSASVA